MTPFTREDILRYGRDDYEIPSYAWPYIRRFHFYKRDNYKGNKDPWWWKPAPLNWTVRLFRSVIDYVHYNIWRDWLGDRMNWMPECSPSFPQFFGRILHNIVLFLTPWYHLRRSFICAWINYNGSKLLNDGLDFGYVRTRDSDVEYYKIVFTGFHYRITKKILRDSNGESTTGFLVGLSLAFSDKSDEEKQAELDFYTEEKSTVCMGWVFNMKQAVKELNRIAELTPNLGWYNPKDWNNEDLEEPAAEIRIPNTTEEDKHDN